MKYLEVKELIESLPKNRNIDYSIDVKFNTEKLLEEAEIYSLNIRADFVPSLDNPSLIKCVLEIYEQEVTKNYKVYHEIPVASGGKYESLAIEIFKKMKEFTCKQMVKE